MVKESISKNFLLQFLYQGLILIIPLILSPYLTRILQEAALGVYSYTNSIAYYFVVLSMLGITRYGQRIVSQNSSDEIKLRKFFWSLFIIHVIVSFFSVCLFACFILFFGENYRIIYLIQIFYILCAMFDVTWLFYGLGDFKSVVVKNTFVKILECILIFIFVNTPSDLWKYALISTLGLLFGQMIMLPKAMRTVPFILVHKSDCLPHVKPLLIFSISVIAVSLYTVFDKILLGIMTSESNVAFYEYSNRIITIPKIIIGVVNTVVFPYTCKLVKEGNISIQRKYIEYSFLIVSLIGMGSFWGLLSIGEQFALFYYGDSFRICGSVMMCLSPIIYIIGVGDVIRTQYMIPNHMDKMFNLCILLNAIINIIISVLLIPSLGIYGAVIGTVSAELSGLVYQLTICNKFINTRQILQSAMPFLFMGAIMYILIKVLHLCNFSGVEGLLIEILFGGIVYLILCFVYFFFFRKEIFSVVLKKMHRCYQ